ncbi:hypothetical protein GCM10022396_09140 [Flavivirga amylovorans]
MQTQELPDLSPLSPNAASIAKYGEMPSGTFTGVPNIGIPLYTIESSELKLPLSLSYHAGGNKVTSIASWVGLGWSLNSIPSISRTVKGIADEYGIIPNNNFDPLEQLVAVNFNSTNGSTFRQNLYQTPYSRDASPDVFYYNLPTESGRFMFNESIREFVTIPHTNTKITYERDAVTLKLTFKLTTETGEEYIFDVRENTNIVGSITTSTWKASKILSATKKDSIVFEYEDEQYTNFVFGKGVRYEALGASFLSLSNTVAPAYPSNGFGDFGLQAGFYNFSTKRLSKITFANGSVEFKENPIAREDIATSYNNASYNLQYINVYNKHSTCIKKYKFNYKYLTGGGDNVIANTPYSDPSYTKWMLLASLEELSPVSTKKLTHYFSYDETYIPSRRTSCAQDYWGYYNGAETNENLVPTVTVFNFLKNKDEVFEGADRQVNTNKCKFGILKRIIYPTGGYTEYDFESNMISTAIEELPSDFVADNHGNYHVGGLRIKEIRNHKKGIAAPVTYKYKYTTDYNSNISSGDIFNHRLFSYHSIFTYYMHASVPQSGWNAVVTSFAKITSESTLQAIDFFENIIGYGNVIVETNDADQSGYTEYKFDITGANLPKSWFNVSVPLPINFTTMKRGNLLEETIYKKEVSSFVPVQKRKLTYNYRTEFGNNTDIMCTEWNKNELHELWIGHNPEFHSYPNSYGYWFQYNTDEYGAYRIIPFFKTLSNETIENYYNGDIATTSTDYFYDNFAHQKATKTETRNSKGQLIQTTTKYPQDIASPTSAEQKLIDQNRVGLPIETTSFIDTNSNNIIEESNETVSKLKNNYFEWFSNIIELKDIESLKGTSPPEERISFSGYDGTNGKPVEVSKTDGARIVYIWGYNGQYPIAKIENASYSEVSGQVSNLQNLSNADNDRTVDIINTNGSMNHQGNEGALRSALRALRDLPVLTDALVTTYTYDPLVGITSITDPKGYVAYYEYDEFNRLKQVKDTNGNILSENSYNYVARGPGIETKLSTPTPGVAVGDNVQVTLSSTGGSGNFTYKWLVSNENINDEYTSFTDVFNLTTTGNHLPGFTVTVIVTDNVNGDVSSSSIILECVDVLVIDSITYSIENTNTIQFGTWATYQVNTSGGSGNFKYEWDKYVDNPEWLLDVSLNGKPEYNNASLVTEPLGALDCPNIYMTCIVTDLTTEKTAYSTVVINIGDCP